MSRISSVLLCVCLVACLVVPVSASGYTNLLCSATDTDGSIYNGVGYASGYRISSSGAVSPQSGFYATGFIPCSSGAVVYLKNIDITIGNSNNRLSFYDSNKNHICQTDSRYYASYLGGSYDDSGVYSFTVQNFSSYDLSSVAYIRFCCANIDESSVVTVNQYPEDVVVPETTTPAVTDPVVTDPPVTDPPSAPGPEDDSSADSVGVLVSVTSALDYSVQWVGAVVSSLVLADGKLSGLLPVLVVAIGVSAFLLVGRIIRSSSWGG